MCRTFQRGATTWAWRGRKYGASSTRIALYAGGLSAYHLAFPQKDITISHVITARDGERLTLVAFQLRNGAIIALKDPVIACDMKGPSGTTIATATKTIYETLPAETTRQFLSVDMGKIPEQAVTFNCYVTSAAIKW